MASQNALNIRLSLLVFLYLMVWAACNRLALHALGLRLDLWGSLFYAGGQVHSLLINLTPAVLGVMEAYSVFAGSVLGFTPAEALLGQGILRLASAAVLLATGFIGGLVLAFKKPDRP